MALLDAALQAIFWISAAALLHSYAVYPALVRRLARGRRPHELVHGAGGGPESWPRVVAAMAAHNEESVIGRTLETILASDYPKALLEVVVAADNCSDRTVEIVRSFQKRHPNLRLKELAGRNGKIRALNLALADLAAGGGLGGDDVLILCDANVRWSARLPRELAKHFRNPRIGIVASNVLDGRERHGGIADDEEAYVNRENEIKHAEGLLWGRMMGAFGACFAMRGHLFEPVPEHFRSDDFTHTLRCFERGYDAIVEPAATAFEDVSEDLWVEFGRKKRISVGNLQNLAYFREFLRPGRAGWATWFAFWSHKGLRWLGPWFIAGALVSGLALAPFHPFYALAAAGQVAGILAALAEAPLARGGIRIRALRSARYFLLMNVALAVGAWRYFTGETGVFWEPSKRLVPDHAPPAAVRGGAAPARPARAVEGAAASDPSRTGSAATP